MESSKIEKLETIALVVVLTVNIVHVLDLVTTVALRILTRIISIL